VPGGFYRRFPPGPSRPPRSPPTPSRFTGHLQGAIYGAPQKIRDGRTPLKNLYLCGTDQGLMGIIGAMLSGISMANVHILHPGARE
jgi:phytoene dehydrogenase-like protein